MKHALFPAPEVRYLKLLRRTQSCKNRLLRKILNGRLILLGRKTHIQIPAATKIGRGLYIGHCGPVVINPKAEIGMNCNIAIGVTIGQENRGRREGAPKIGNKVWIGTNAVIVGAVTIGDEVLVAPNSFVNFDVPPRSIVIGNPARVIPSENAVEGYINHCVE